MLPSFRVLGVSVNAVQMPDAVARLRSWIDDDQATTHFVAVTSMHGIAESRQSSDFRQVLNIVYGAAGATKGLFFPNGITR